ncbi:GNAT family N-acetyltransferase [uncultured Nocardioides sp.]|uniref:GNAT family N-acetyltransferase n=1 Tax=uncultured Nocardioides sp. TaxID=198441 RepID=UPI002621C852|nr:GNAT family N-acetyltransferase [uncultured Nocardioides sp.]
MPTDEAAPAPVAESELVLRPADEDDADALALIHLLARRAAPMPDPVHSDDDVRRWLRERVADHAPGAETWVAEVEGVPVGYARTTAGWLDDLYVQPAHQGTGVGAALLDLVTARQPDGFCLWVFESNRPAREFYARHGLVELERTDGSANEEGEPDVRLAWPGEDPVAFLRGLVDEVDAQLGDLLARRAALTRAIQPLKSSTRRDPARERAVAEHLATRAPALGVDRLERIVRVVVEESLDAASD